MEPSSIKWSCAVILLKKKNALKLTFLLMILTISNVTSFDKFIFIISKRSQTHEENTCRIILYTLSLKKKLHTCIIPCNTVYVVINSCSISAEVESFFVVPLLFPFVLYLLGCISMDQVGIVINN